MAKLQSFKQVEALCRKVLEGRCKVFNSGYGEHEHGHLEVTLIVGRKVNPSYETDAKIGPNSKPYEPDMRTLYIQFGEDERWLVDKLNAVKESAEKNRTELNNQMMSSSEKKGKKDVSKEEMLKAADDIGEGKDPGVTADDEEDPTPVDWSDDKATKAADEVAEEFGEDDKDASNEPDKVDQLADVVGTLAKNVETVNKKLNKLNKST